MNLRKSLLLAAAGLLTCSTAAQSQSFGGYGEIVKVAGKNAGEWDVYVGQAGVPDGTEVIATLDGLVKVRGTNANGCGIATFSDTQSYPRTLITGLDFNALPVQELPKCDTTTGTLAEPRTVNFRTPDNKTVLVGQSPGLRSTLEYTIPKSKKAKARSGMVRFSRITDAVPNGGADITLNGVGYDIGNDIPTVTISPYSRKDSVSGNYNLYIPQAWLTAGGGGGS